MIACQAVNKYYPKNHVVLNLLGTLQAARPAQVPAPYPNDDYYSPAEYALFCCAVMAGRSPTSSSSSSQAHAGLRAPDRRGLHRPL